MKIILDVDTGIDDSLAIVYGLASKEAEFVGITTVFGNVLCDTAFRNTVDLLKLFDREDIPVYRGAAKPWGQADYEVSQLCKMVHGTNGIGEVQLEHCPRTVPEKSAAQFMVYKARELSEELTLVCVGPLTNLAEAIRLDKQALMGINKVVIMGGALTIKGNASLFAEANIHNDPLAAAYVFESGVKIDMVPLDVTLQTLISEKELESWKQSTSERAKALYQMSAYYYGNEHKEEGNKGYGALHDPLALEAAINPDIISSWHECDLTVETQGPSAGRTIADKKTINHKDHRMRTALKVQGDEFVRKFIERVTTQF